MLWARPALLLSGKCNLLTWPQLHTLPISTFFPRKLAPIESTYKPMDNGRQYSSKDDGTPDPPLVLGRNGVDDGSRERLLAIRTAEPPVNCGEGADGGIKQ